VQVKTGKNGVVVNGYHTINAIRSSNEWLGFRLTIGKKFGDRFLPHLHPKTKSAIMSTPRKWNGEGEEGLATHPHNFMLRLRN